MSKRRAGKRWRSLTEAANTTANALIELGLPRNQGAAATDMILLVAKFWGDKQYKRGSQWSI